MATPFSVQSSRTSPGVDLAAIFRTKFPQAPQVFVHLHPLRCPVSLAHLRVYFRDFLFGFLTFLFCAAVMGCTCICCKRHRQQDKQAKEQQICGTIFHLIDYRYLRRYLHGAYIGEIDMFPTITLDYSWQRIRSGSNL